MKADLIRHLREHNARLGEKLLVLSAQLQQAHSQQSRRIQPPHGSIEEVLPSQPPPMPSVSQVVEIHPPPPEEGNSTP